MDYILTITTDKIDSVNHLIGSIDTDVRTSKVYQFYATTFQAKKIIRSLKPQIEDGFNRMTLGQFNKQGALVRKYETIYDNEPSFLADTQWTDV